MSLTAGAVGLDNIGAGVVKNLAAARHHVIGYDTGAERISAADVEAGADILTGRAPPRMISAILRGKA